MFNSIKTELGEFRESVSDHMAEHTGVYRVIWFLITVSSLVFSVWAFQQYYPGGPMTPIPFWLLFTPWPYVWFVEELIFFLLPPLTSGWIGIVLVVLFILIALGICRLYIWIWVAVVRAVYSGIHQLIKVAVDVWEYDRDWIISCVRKGMIIIFVALFIWGCAFIIQWILGHPIILAALIIGTAIILRAIILAVVRIATSQGDVAEQEMPPQKK